MPSLRFIPSGLDYVEPTEDYRPGGFHPVEIADLFAEGRYKVVHKLGSGGSSTIWLAREQGGFGGLVTIKVIRAELSSGNSIEEVPELSVPMSVSPFFPCANVQTPLDYFVEVGPNGSHLCLVYPLAGPSILAMSFSPGRVVGSRRLRKDLAKKVAKQLACTVELMHCSGFVHGDITPSNVLFRFAGNVAKWSDQELYLNFGQPKTEKIVTLDHSPPGPHTPSKLVAPIDNARFTNSTLLQENIVLIDFGQSFPFLSPPTDYKPATAPQYTSPEAYFEGRIGPPADVWSLACTIFQIRAGFPLFEAYLGGKDFVLKEIVATLGKMPDPWWGAFNARHLWFDEDGNPKVPGSAEKTSIKQELASIGSQDASRGIRDDGPMAERPGTMLDEVELQVLGDLLEKMLCYKPQDRIKMCEVVAHPWFSLE